MSQDFCMGCGVFLSSYSMICDVCGFDNSFGQYGEIPLGDELLIDSFDEYIQDTPPDY